MITWACRQSASSTYARARRVGLGGAGRAHGRERAVHALGAFKGPETQLALAAVVGTLEFANGAVASFLISDCGEWRYPSKWFFQVSDGERKAVITNHCRTALIEDGTERVDDSRTAAHEIGTAEALDDFLSAIREGRDPRVSGLDGLRAAVVVEAAMESLRSGNPAEVRLPTG